MGIYSSSLSAAGARSDRSTGRENFERGERQLQVEESQCTLTAAVHTRKTVL